MKPKKIQDQIYCHWQNCAKYENKKLVLHCHSGERSASACQKLVGEDSNLEIYNLEGGISSLSAEGCEIETSGNFFLPLDRLGFLWEVFWDIWLVLFFLLSRFFGAGLMFARLSGYCGLAILMAEMPWNKGCQNISSRLNICKIT